MSVFNEDCRHSAVECRLCDHARECLQSVTMERDVDTDARFIDRLPYSRSLK